MTIIFLSIYQTVIYHKKCYGEWWQISLAVTDRVEPHEWKMQLNAATFVQNPQLSIPQKPKVTFINNIGSLLKMWLEGKRSRQQDHLQNRIFATLPERSHPREAVTPVTLRFPSPSVSAAANACAEGDNHSGVWEFHSFLKSMGCAGGEECEKVIKTTFGFVWKKKTNLSAVLQFIFSGNIVIFFIIVSSRSFHSRDEWLNLFSSFN